VTVSGSEQAIWDLRPLLDGRGEAAIDELLERADELADALACYRGRVGELDAQALARFMAVLGELHDVAGRVDAYATLRFASDSATGALVDAVQERVLDLETKVVFFELEWAELAPQSVESLLADPCLDECRNYLRVMYAQRRHLLTEPEERVVAAKSVTGQESWVRLFDELNGSVSVVVDEEAQTLDEAFSLLAAPDRSVRRAAASAITAALEPGLRTKAFILNTLVQDQAIEDELRGFDHWLARRNLEHQVSDGSIDALMSSVVARSDLSRRWYALKAGMLGLDRLADYDRMAPVVDEDVAIGWNDAVGLVLDAYRSFSPLLASHVRRLFDGGWIDAAPRPGKQGGAFCAYTVPSVHPYVLVNYNGRRRDVIALAHEVGHGLHALLAAPRGIFHHQTPATLTETASVFGETLMLDHLLSSCSSPSERLALLAERIEATIANLFRQAAMHRFEELVHGLRRTEGELSVERIGELWNRTQAEMLGDAVDLTEGYASWWSFVPHFFHAPGTVHTYAYAQLLALSLYQRYQEGDPAFVDSYLGLLSAGGSRPVGTLVAEAGCDLDDPGSWNGGLAVVARLVEDAEAAARTIRQVRG
jgi:oligoendopeptidase F